MRVTSTRLVTSIGPPQIHQRPQRKEDWQDVRPMRQQDLQGVKHSCEEPTETWPNMQDRRMQGRGRAQPMHPRWSLRCMGQQHRPLANSNDGENRSEADQSLMRLALHRSRF